MLFVNIAHGDFIVLTCYVLLLLTSLLGLNPVVATLIVLPAAFLFGFGLQRFCCSAWSARTCYWSFS
jgi:branched-chain amino acid transport system permease protein